MKSKITVIIFLALFASCGTREDLKEDLTLPELPPQEQVVVVTHPKNTDVYYIGKKDENIMYIAWEGLPLSMPIRMDLYKKDMFIAVLQIRTGVDNTICRLPDTLITSVHYKVKVYEEINPNIFGFSEQFTIKGLPENDTVSIPQ